jgi:hypothetical protein
MQTAELIFSQAALYVYRALTFRQIVLRTLRPPTVWAPPRSINPANANINTVPLTFCSAFGAFHIH